MPGCWYQTVQIAPYKDNASTFIKQSPINESLTSLHRCLETVNKDRLEETAWTVKINEKSKFFLAFSKLTLQQKQEAKHFPLSAIP